MRVSQLKGKLRLWISSPKNDLFVDKECNSPAPFISCPSENKGKWKWRKWKGCMMMVYECGSFSLFWSIVDVISDSVSGIFHTFKLKLVPFSVVLSDAVFACSRIMVWKAQSMLLFLICVTENKAERARLFRFTRHYCWMCGSYVHLHSA